MNFNPFDLKSLTVEDIFYQTNLPASYCFEIGLLDAKLAGWYQDDTLFTNYRVTAQDVVVDVGCGDGANLQYCGEKGAHLIAADIDEEKVWATVNRLKQGHARKVEGVVGDSNPLAIGDAVATRVICTEVIEHVDDTAQFLSELVRIGKPNARYLLTVPDMAGENLQKKCGAPDVYFQKPNHIRIIGRDEFAEMVTEAGLIIETRSSYGFYWVIWWLFYWHCESQGLKTDDPLAISWAKTWHMLMLQPKFTTLRDELDRLFPKSQIIIAHKPA